jgi:hypothetical protein
MSQIHHEDPVVESEKKPEVDRHDNASIRPVKTIQQEPTNLTHIRSHVSHTHDAPMEHYSSYIEIPDEVCMLYSFCLSHDFSGDHIPLFPEQHALSNC